MSAPVGKYRYRQPTNASQIGYVACSVRTKRHKWKKLTDTVTYFIVKGSLSIYVGFHAKRDLRAYFFKFAFLAAIATSVRNVALDQKKQHSVCILLRDIANAINVQ